MREIESMMRVESGDIAVLGGLMEDRLDNRTGRLPGLGDIPFLGEVFNTRSTRRPNRNSSFSCARR
jgi:type II secretory pathway component GspD/PulD (secretin)